MLLELEPDAVGRGVAGAGPGGAGAGALLGHGGVEAGEVDGAALLAQRVLREVEREAEGVVKPEGDRAGQSGAVAELRGLLVEKVQAALQHGAEAVFLEFQRSVISASARGESG